jgi:DNA-binding transcriptional MerR regulator
MRYLIALFAALGFSLASAQSVSSTTPNLITSGTDHTWTGVTSGSVPTDSSGGPGPLYDPATGTIYFSSGNTMAVQTFAINTALANAGTGIRLQGYNYSWDINTNINTSPTQNGPDKVTAYVITTYPNGEVRRTDTYTYNTGFDWTTQSGSVVYNVPGPTSEFGDLSVKFKATTTGFAEGYFGPQVRNINLSLNYLGPDPCTTNPLYSTACSGYQQAYQAQMCTANPLYDSSCPGYASALFTQQCSNSPLSSPACPTYTKKVIELVDSIKPKLEDTKIAEITEKIDPTSSDAKKKVTPNGDANPQAPVKLNSPKADLDGGGSGVMKESKDKRTVAAEDDSDPKTNREALAKKRREEVKKAAVEKGKELANEAGKAADLQTQLNIQNLVVQAMGHSPAFDVYSRTKMPDTQFYVAREVYSGQKNIDAPAGRRLFSGSDLSHQQMIDQQYNLGN